MQAPQRFQRQVLSSVTHGSSVDGIRLDRLQWYCRNPVHMEPTIIHEDVIYFVDLGTQLTTFVKAWMADEDLRRCKKCGTIAPPK